MKGKIRADEIIDTSPLGEWMHRQVQTRLSKDPNLASRFSAEYLESLRSKLIASGHHSLVAEILALRFRRNAVFDSESKQTTHTS